MKLEIDYARPELEGIGQDVLPVRDQLDAAVKLLKWAITTDLEVLRATYIDNEGNRVEGYPKEVCDD